MKSVERRYNDLQNQIERKLQTLKSTSKTLANIQAEIDKIRNWVKEKLVVINEPLLIGFEVSGVDKHLLLLKVSIIEYD